MELTAEQRAVTVSALWDLLVETRQYLRSTGPRSPGHDDCCPTARARSAHLDEQHAALQDRERHVLAALDQFDPGGEHRTD